MLTERGSCHEWLKVIEGKRGFTIGLRALCKYSLQSHLLQLSCCDLIQTASELAARDETLCVSNTA